MTDPVTSAPKPGSGRGMKIALALSLAVNLAVVGVVAGAFLRDGPPRGGRDFGIGPLSEAFTRADRQALRAAFVDHGGGIRANRQAMRADIQTLVGILRADVLDPVALNTTLASMSQRNDALLSTARAVLAQRLQAMTPEERAAFADRLERKVSRGWRDDGGED